MTGKGFTIRQLLVTGDNVDRASVEFSPGLNVIAYMSQSGKSYILECIDFMLGGKTPPRNIKQSKGYDTVWMEIVDATGQAYVLRRPLGGGAFQLYRMSLADLKSDSPWTRLATTNSARTSASAFFLRMSGFPTDAKLRNNAANAKSNLSFRTISHFFIVNEISMIDDPSPIQTRAGYAITIERSAFKFLLTGQDDSNLEELEPAPAELVSDRVRREVYDELISQHDSELAQLRGQATPDRNEIDSLIETTSAEIEAINAQIREQEAARRENFLASLEAESRLLVLNELLS